MFILIKIRKREAITDSDEIQRTDREYFGKLHFNNTEKFIKWIIS